MSESEFWIAVWRIVGVCFCILVATIGSCTMHSTYRMSRAADPLAFACAQNQERNAGACLVLARDRK